MCLFNSLLDLTPKKTSKLHIIGPLWGDSISDWWVPNTKGPHIAKFMGPTWGPPGSCRSQMGPNLAPWPCYQGQWYGKHFHATMSCWVNPILPNTNKITPQGSLRVWAQPMRGDIIMQCTLSLAESMHRMISAPLPPCSEMLHLRPHLKKDI